MIISTRNEVTVLTFFLLCTCNPCEYNCSHAFCLTYTRKLNSNKQPQSCTQGSNYVISSLRSDNHKKNTFTILPQFTQYNCSHNTLFNYNEKSPEYLYSYMDNFVQYIDNVRVLLIFWLHPCTQCYSSQYN